MRALVVDDSSVMRRVLVTALVSASIDHVDEVCDGAEAVQATQAEDYDLVLMDWNMPNMLGIDAVRAIRANGKTMPIIMVTTESERSRVVEAIKAGASNYITKPFDHWTMLTKIQSVLAHCERC